MKLLSRVAAFVAACTCIAASADTYSDLWYVPNESGWGVNVVQQGETAFATLFVYGPDGKAAWFVAPDAQVFAYTGSGHPAFRGPLYRTRGPWYAGAFDPAAVQAQVAGEITMEFLGYDRLRLAYVAEGASVTRELRRQTFAAVQHPGQLAGQFVMRVFDPGESVPRVEIVQATVYAEFGNGRGWMRVSDEFGRTCHYRGPYRQAGQLIEFSGTYACSTAAQGEGTFEIERLQVTADGVTGFLRASGPGTSRYGRFAAAKY